MRIGSAVFSSSDSQSSQSIVCVLPVLSLNWQANWTSLVPFKNAFQVIDPKALQQRRKNLQKTSDIKESEKVVNHLLGVVDKLQTHISDHWNFCQQGQNCGDCDKSKLQQDLIMGELALLHYQLGQMTSGRRRMSLSGVSHERIYRLAERTFSVCEEHRKMHQMVRRKSCASLNDLDSCDDSSEDEFIGPIQVNRYSTHYCYTHVCMQGNYVV